MREIVRGEWPAGGVTFAVSRGSFEIPSDVIARAEMTDDDFEIRQLFAASMPGGARTFKRERAEDGAVRVHWRRILIVAMDESDRSWLDSRGRRAALPAGGRRPYRQR